MTDDKRVAWKGDKLYEIINQYYVKNYHEKRADFCYELTKIIIKLIEEAEKKARVDELTNLLAELEGK